MPAAAEKLDNFNEIAPDASGQLTNGGEDALISAISGEPTEPSPSTRSIKAKAAVYENSLHNVDHRLGHLSRLILSNLIEAGGAAPVEELQLQVDAEGLTSEQTPIDFCLNKLLGSGLIEQEEGQATATKKAKDYMTLTADPGEITKASDKVRGMREFSIDRYTILGEMPATSEGSWLLESSSLAGLVSQITDVPTDIVTETMKDFRQNGLIEETPVTSKNSSDMIRLKLTKTGTRELATISEVFPNESKAASGIYEQRRRIQDMCKEIDKLRTELGYEDERDGVDEDKDNEARAQAKLNANESFRALKPSVLGTIRAHLDKILYDLITEFDDGNERYQAHLHLVPKKGQREPEWVPEKAEAPYVYGLPD